MRYLGGKARTAGKISSYINSLMEQNGTDTYVEPFVGAGWILERIICGNRYAFDLCQDLIALWSALQNGWIPPETLSKEEYGALREAECSALRAFAGFGCSHSGKWFGGYAKDSSGRNYAGNAKRSLLKKVPHILDVEFKCKSYEEVSCCDALIYCDPPYAGTTGYNSVDAFETDKFWKWARRMSKDNIVVVSEYVAPDDFECVLEIPTKTDMHGGNMQRVEKLFRLKPQEYTHD